MTVSELIVKLQHVQSQHGNIRVFVEGNGNDLRVPFETNDFEQCGNHVAPAEPGEHESDSEDSAYLII